MEIEKLLEELLLVPGVSGYEDKIREKITALVKDHLDQVETDSLGNLIGTKEGKEKGHIAFFAHMDELGLVVTNFTADGFIRFRKVGGIDDRVLPSRHVQVITTQGKAIPGVIAWVPPHMAIDRGKDLERTMGWQDLLIDVGASSEKEVQSMGIKIADPVVFTKQISYLANNRMASRGMDNRAGCAVLVSLIQKLKKRVCKGKISFVFTTQEEYGLRGATVAGYTVKPDNAFIIDTSSAPDFPGVPEVYKRQFQISKGPVIRAFDTRMVANQKLKAFVEKVADNKNIPYQLGVVGGSTDAAAIQLARGGVPSLPICIPCRYTHATVELVSIEDLKTTINLLEEIVGASI